MPRRLIAGLAACAGVFAAAACDRGNADERPPEARVMACDLTTQGEVASALGADVGPPDATDDEGADALAGRSGCAWATRDGHAAALFELVRTADMSGAVRRTGFSAAARFGAARSRHPEAANEQIGDRSFWVDEIATLYVLKDASYIVIEIATAPPSAARTAALRLAASAVARLDDEDGQTGRADE